MVSRVMAITYYIFILPFGLVYMLLLYRGNMVSQVMSLLIFNIIYYSFDYLTLTKDYRYCWDNIVSRVMATSFCYMQF